MAHHNRTPESVLTAPEPSRIVVCEHRGLTREERRGRRPVHPFRRAAGAVFTNTPVRGKVREYLKEASQ